mmetsp:Transcript_50347/g.162968  ORF Transcript_50347/g.162968 Transcript_50347/m.162968 type:complete len:81 (-) Transcript_50347:358-600(-)
MRKSWRKPNFERLCLRHWHEVVGHYLQMMRAPLRGELVLEREVCDEEEEKEEDENEEVEEEEKANNGATDRILRRPSSLR